VSVRGLSHRYRGAAEHALRDVSLDIRAGSSVGLLGPNGAGKSTLIDLLNGVTAPQAGEILVEGLPAGGHGRRLKAVSAYAPQNLAFHTRLTVAENLRFFAAACALAGATARTRIDEAVAACELGPYLGRRSGVLSGGLKRRLNLAIALLNAPRILYLDEPTVGIDAASRDTIIRAIAALNRAGRTIVYTSHYLEEVEALCTEIVILREGRIVFQAPLAEMVGRDDARRSRLYFDRPLTEDQAGRLKAAGGVIAGPREAWFPDHDIAALAEALRRLDQEGLTLERATWGARRLEDVYLQHLAA
jgi:ABC-2 type transport system ATP-binding protein